MLHLFLAAALAPAWLGADAPLSAGTQLTYRGTLAPAAGESDNGQKSFDLTLWITARNDAGTEVFWLVDENGNGQFPWPRRFGRTVLDAQFRASSGPALLYDRGEDKSAVPVALPFFAADKPLAKDADFRDGNLEFHVDKPGEFTGRAGWHVSVRDPFGPKRTMLVEQDGPLVLRSTERVVLGRGEEYRLVLELVGSEQLDGEALKKLASAIERMTALRDRLNLPPQGHEIEWNPAQLELLAKQLPAVAEASAGTALANLATAASRDAELQANRSDALAGMRDKFQGRDVEAFSAHGIDGAALDAADLKGQVTVLHFWDYRDEPLREPYGQVGYLDFLYHRRKEGGLKLYGVAVDGRLSDRETRTAAERSVKKLKAFMNLSYPVLLDSGGLLKQFGDPRVVGGSLPLFVVIGPDAKILHYHSGHYEVHQDQGLKELDTVVVEALSKVDAGT